MNTIVCGTGQQFAKGVPWPEVSWVDRFVRRDAKTKGRDELMKQTAKEPKNDPSAPKGGPVKFHTKILQAGKTATGIQIPDEVIEKLGAGKRPPICVTINGQTYRSTVAVMDGKFMVGVSAENRAKTGVAGGDEVDVEIALDTEPREVSVPAGFAQALKANPAAKKKFDELSYSKKQGFVSAIEGAKTQETRERRIQKAIEELKRV
jgi:hypothetical protein